MHGSKIIPKLSVVSFIIIIFFIPVVRADTWSRTFGGSGVDHANSVIQTSDGGYLIAGYTDSVTGTYVGDAWLMKVDANGVVQWEKTYGGSGDDFASEVIEIAENNYVFIGGLDVTAGASYNLWIVWLDCFGNISQQKTYGITDYCCSSYLLHPYIQQTANQDFIVTANKRKDVGDAFVSVPWLLRLNNSGTVLWQQTIDNLPQSGHSSEYARKILETNDSGFIILATTDEFYPPEPDFACAWGTWLIKVSSTGSIQWQKIYGFGDPGNCDDFPGGGYSGLDIALTSDGGYIVVGGEPAVGTTSSFPNSYVMRLDGNGNVLWQNDISTQPYGSYAQSVYQTSNGDFIVAAEVCTDVCSTDWFLGAPQTPAEGEDGVLILKLNGSGSLQWQRFFSVESSMGALEDIESIRPTTDGGIVAVGNTGLHGQYPSYDSDLWFLKLDSSGNIDQTCSIQGSISTAVTSITSVHTAAARVEIITGGDDPVGGTATEACYASETQEQCAFQQSLREQTVSTPACQQCLIFYFPKLGTNKRVLIHNYRKFYGDPYPESQRQVQDGQIEIEVHGPPNTPIFFRKIDPPDSSTILPPSARHENDNQGGIPSFTSSITTDPNGVIKAVLTLPKNGPEFTAVGGDNYQLEASLDEQFTCGTNCPKSGTITVWKRAYIEHTLMYRTGEFITQKSGFGTSSPKKVYVSDVSKFSVGQEVHIFSAESTQHLTGEYRTISSISTTKKTLTLNSALQLTYQPTNDLNCGPPGDPNCAIFPYSYIADLNSVIPGIADVDELKKAYDDSFVEWKIIGGYSIPGWILIPFTTEEQKDNFIKQRSEKYFTYSVEKNHLQVVDAGRYEVDGTPVTYNGRSYDDKNISWIFIDRIVNAYPEAPVNAIQNVTAHELGHQWNVNSSILDGHDQFFAARNDCVPATEKCLMNTSRDRTLGVDKFHCNESYIWDLYCIRGHVDDLFQNQCNWNFQ